MEEKDNVCEEISTAGQEKVEKSPLGKFKDVNALLQAYNSLEAEFTRRSQRLKELERTGNTDGGEPLSSGVGEEKNPTDNLQKIDRQQPAESSVPDTQQPEEGKAARTQELQGAGVEEKQADAGEKHLDGGEGHAPSAAEIYRLASTDEKVRLQIIGDYLQSLQTSGAPISKGGVGALLTPPKKPKNVNEAGNMALRMFKENTQNQF